MKIAVFFIIFFILPFALADKPISYSGRVMDVSDVAVENQNTKFSVKITNASTCVLYAEEFNVDMTNSNGYFKVVLGSGTLGYASTGVDIFRSKTYVCQDGSSWSASATDIRKVSFSVKVGDEPWVNFSEDVINSVAYANDSEYLKGKSVADFIQIGPITTQAKVDALAAQTSNILDLINGTNNVYAKQTLLDAALSTKQNSLTYSPINPANNLSELTSPSTARSNLGLGNLAVRSSISDLDISSVAWSKITDVPLRFEPAAHTHVVADITDLSLSGKVDKFDLVCSSAQVLQYLSVTDTFNCVEIQTGGDLSGNLITAVVNKIQGRQVSPSPPNDGDILRYNSSNARWEPTNFTPPPITPPGTRVGYLGTTAPDGWVLASGKTIGKTGSGATERANNDTRALFVLLWESYSNSILPVSSGRGATAGIDFDAGKTIQLPDYRGRSAIGKDDMGGSASGRVSGSSGISGSIMGSSGGSEMHTLSWNEMPAHTHGKGSRYGVGGTFAGSIYTGNSPGMQVDASEQTASAGGNAAHNNMQPSIVELFIIKL